jgi:hypothetical protein
MADEGSRAGFRKLRFSFKSTMDGKERKKEIVLEYNIIVKAL